MPAHSADRPISRVTLNLYAEDVKNFKSRYGFGWSAQVRELVHRNVKEWEKEHKPMEKTNHD